MTDPKFLPVQATRSFDDYVQGAPYLIDTADDRLVALLGAGYFSEDVNPALQIGQYADSGQLLTGNDLGMAEQEHVNVEAGWKPANDVPVPEKMTGSKRASTADEEPNDAEVGTEQGADRGDRKSGRSAARKSSGKNDN
jgi:hypothetical protein